MNSRNPRTEALRSLLKESMEHRGEHSFTMYGVSMTPFLKEGDRATVVSRDPGSICAGDPILFEEEGRMIIHRVIKVLNDGFLTKGDNTLRFDPPVAIPRYLGVLAKIGGRTYRTGRLDVLAGRISGWQARIIEQYVFKKERQTLNPPPGKSDIPLFFRILVYPLSVLLTFIGTILRKKL